MFSDTYSRVYVTPGVWQVVAPEGEVVAVCGDEQRSAEILDALNDALHNDIMPCDY